MAVLRAVPIAVPVTVIDTVRACSGLSVPSCQTTLLPTSWPPLLALTNFVPCGRASSSTDVAVLLQKERKDRADFESDLEEQLRKMTEHRVKVRLLNGASLPFCLNVVRTGRVILDPAPNMRAEFQGRILKESFDFYRYRKRYWTQVLQRPRL